jgi:hypothetical protein
MIDPREQSSLFYVLEQLAWDLEVERAWVFDELERVKLEAGELEGARGYFDDRRLRARAAEAAEKASEPWREIVYRAPELLGGVVVDVEAGWNAEPVVELLPLDAAAIALALERTTTRYQCQSGHVWLAKTEGERSRCPHPECGRPVVALHLEARTDVKKTGST